MSDRFALYTNGQLRVQLSPQVLLNFDARISGGLCVVLCCVVCCVLCMCECVVCCACVSVCCVLCMCEFVLCVVYCESRYTNGQLRVQLSPQVLLNFDAQLMVFVHERKNFANYAVGMFAYCCVVGLLCC